MFGLNELSELNRDVRKSCGTEYPRDLANNWVIGGDLVFAKELLHERSRSLKHDMPLAIVGATRILVRVAGHAHKVGDALVASLISPSKVLHTDHIGIDAGFRERSEKPLGEVLAKAAVVNEVGADYGKIEAISLASDIDDQEVLPLKPSG